MAAPDQPRNGPTVPDRYEAMPDIAHLPGWLWRKTPVWGRVLLGLLLVVAVGLVLLLGPGIQEAKERDAQAEAERIARAKVERIEALRREQRPRTASGTPAPDDVAARLRLIDETTVAIRADARRRVAAGALTGPIKGVDCEPFPRNVARVGNERDLGERYGNYSCLAVTAEFGASGEGREAWGESESGVLGHPYRARLDFETGAISFCKISGRPAEGGLTQKIDVTVPRECGGR
jgi:hypothetical protein